MLHIVYILLPYYFCINCFIAGNQFNEEMTWGKPSVSDKLRSIAWILLLILFACILLGVSLFWEYIVTPISNFIQQWTQHGFWFTWVFNRKEYKNLDNEMLQNYNNAKTPFKAGGFRDRHWKYCLKLINEANNYTHAAN